VAVVGPGPPTVTASSSSRDATPRVGRQWNLTWRDSPARAADERVGVDAGAVHVAVVGGDADVVEEEGEHICGGSPGGGGRRSRARTRQLSWMLGLGVGLA
jgi:hypothetical protein